MTSENFQLDMQGLWDRLPTAFSAARGLKRFSGSPNWVVMKWLLGHGSTYSCQICRQLGLDPNAKMGRIEWGIPAPVPLSGITGDSDKSDLPIANSVQLSEEMVEGILDGIRVRGNTDRHHGIRTGIEKAKVAMIALLRQQPPFTPTQTEE